MAALLLFGTLLDPDLRAIVAGTPQYARPVCVPGRAVKRAADGDYPVLVEGDVAEGLLIEDPDPAALARFDFYEEGFGYVRRRWSVDLDGLREVDVYRPRGGGPEASGEPWSLAEWQRDWGPMTRRAAGEAMAWFGGVNGATLRAMMPTIRVRACSHLRAGAAHAPVGLRSGQRRDDVRVDAARRPYASFFAVEEFDLRHPTFDGGESGRLTRAAFMMGDAVTVLPYDPARDRVLLVEQFRVGPYARGDAHPWSLEPVAGRIDPGEGPEEAALRETEEEAGLTLRRLLPVASYYPSPGAITEYLYSYVGLCDLPDGSDGIGGKADEGEDIRSHVLSFDTLMGLVETGEVDNGPLLSTALWLAMRRGTPGAFA